MASEGADNLDYFVRTVEDLMGTYKTQYKGSLEDFLRSLWASLRRHESEAPSYGLFAKIIGEGFVLRPADYEESWSSVRSPPDNPWFFLDDLGRFFPPERLEQMRLSKEARRKEISDLQILRQTLSFLIADLHSMTSEQLNHRWRYYGLDSPGGHTWYNWDPFTFLECALRGFGGHAERGHLIGTNENRCNRATLAFILELGRVYE